MFNVSALLLDDALKQVLALKEEHRVAMLL